MIGLARHQGTARVDRTDPLQRRRVSQRVAVDSEQVGVPRGVHVAIA